MLGGYTAYQKILSSGCFIELTQEGKLFHIRIGRDFQFVGSLNILGVWMELEEGFYESDFKDKVVLDIGGFQGETAVYFARQGARNIIVYEPVPENCKLILENLRLNQISNAELHAVGVSDHDGFETINYGKIDTGFGLDSTGLEELTFKVENISDVLYKANANVAKIDCEGAEQHLINVSEDILRTIDSYMIETHKKWICSI